MGGGSFLPGFPRCFCIVCARLGGPTLGGHTLGGQTLTAMTLRLGKCESGSMISKRVQMEESQL